MDDREIVELFWKRDESAISEASERYGTLCRGIAYGILRSDSDAEECLNDVWAAAWEAIPPHRPEKLGAFLGRIARNLALKRCRALRAEKRGGGEAALALAELEEILPGGVSPEEQVEQQELARKLDEFLGTLGAAERRVFLCRYWYCDTVAEIAQRFGFGESKVKMMCLRTRRKLLLFLRKEDLLT